MGGCGSGGVSYPRFIPNKRRRRRRRRRTKKETASTIVAKMAGPAVLHHKFTLLPSSLSDFNGIKFNPSTQYHYHPDANKQSLPTKRYKEISATYETKAFAVPRRTAITLMFSSYVFSHANLQNTALALQSVGLKEYIDTFDGYSFKYPSNWIPVRGANADIFFRDPFVLDENISVELSSPSSSKYKSVKDLGPPQVAGEKVIKQYLTEFMSTRLGVKRESSVLSTSSRIADDGKMYYEVEVNIKSYASNNELAVMPQDRVVRLEWDRRYLSVLGVENNQLYELRLQVPENVFVEEESDLRQVMNSFRVNKVSV